MENIKLTIAVAIYNIENYLPKCLESLLNQTEKNNYEILLINDGSTDSSRKICEEYIEKGLKAEIIDKENGGISSVRNLSIDLAKGERILFLDGDDYIEKDTIEIIFKEMEDYDLLVFGFNWINENKVIKDKRIEKNEVIQKENIERLIFKDEINTAVWNKVFKKKVIGDNKIKFLELRVCEDIIFMYEYLRKTKTLKKIDRTLYNYLYRQEGLSNNRDRVFYISYLNFINFFLKRVEKKDLYFFSYISKEYIYLIRALRKNNFFSKDKELGVMRKNIEKEINLKKIIFNKKINLKMKLRYLKIIFSK